MFNQSPPTMTQALRAAQFHRHYPLMASASDDGTVHVFHATVYSDLLRNPLVVPLKILRGHEVRAPASQANHFVFLKVAIPLRSRAPELDLGGSGSRYDSFDSLSRSSLEQAQLQNHGFSCMSSYILVFLSVLSEPSAMVGVVCTNQIFTGGMNGVLIY